LSASAVYSFNPANGVVSTAGKAAWAEMVAGFNFIFLFQDRNGVPGFQYNLGDPVFDCSQNNGYDCIINGSPIDLKQDVSWSAISIASTACPPGYNANCSVTTFTTTGTLSADGTTVFQIVQTIANQKIIITANGHTVGPDYAKIDFTVTYPWASASKNQTANKAVACIGIAGYAGGSAGGAAFVGVFQTRPALVFSGSSGKVAIFGWDPIATVDGVTQNVYVDTISGQEILNYKCPGILSICPAIIAGWQVAAAVVQAIGWNVEIIFLSSPGAGSSTWEYDPTYGAADSTEVTTGGSSFLAPTMYVTLLSFFVLYFYHRQ